jgi:hypothetical protein
MQRRPLPLVAALLLVATGCGSKSEALDSGADSSGEETADGDGSGGDGSDGDGSDGDGSGGDGSDGVDPGPDPFADLVVSFEPGEGAGFGADLFPDVVLGAPTGAGDAGSLDVLSLGRTGEIVLSFDDIGIVDGDGPDLLVFENPFTGWPETGHVAVSEDGETWHEWDCDPLDEEGGFPGCAGVGLVWTHPDNDIDPTDPETAGGDAFDLAELGLERALFVRIRDSGANTYDGTSGGFDLDALAVVNGEEL